MSKKVLIADLANRTGQYALNICQQLNGTNPKFEEKIFYGYLWRQVNMLPEIARILNDNGEKELTGAFVMFRCLLDDFITLLHFNFHDFDKNLIVKHTADGFNEKFKTLQASKKANYKFHQGKKAGMVDEVFYQKEKDRFLADQGNHIMLSNVAGFEFKTFISTSAIADLFPKSDTGEAFCHAFVLWRHLSSYVHYTNFTFVLEN